MIVNIWSTPRTGSTWYSHFLYNKLVRENSRTILIKQYLNQFHFVNYIHFDTTDYIYEYKDGSTYLDYQFDYLGKKLFPVTIKNKRVRNKEEEEIHRLTLLDLIDSKKNNFVFHNHVEPMSKKAYDTLFSKADKNIFLYRENYINQLSSYAIGYDIKNYHQDTFTSNVTVDENILKYLAERIIAWHKLDKSQGEVIKYEDLSFDNCVYSNLPKKQGNTNKFERLSDITKEVVLKLNDYIIQSV